MVHLSWLYSNFDRLLAVHLIQSFLIFVNWESVGDLTGVKTIYPGV